MILILLIFIAACKEGQKQKNNESENVNVENNAENSEMSATFKAPENELVFQQYLSIKKALFNADAKEARKAASTLANSSSESHPSLKSSAKEIASTDDIALQRKAFDQLSNQMEIVLKGSLASGEIHKQYCPMAINHEGAYWISSSKEIENPYLGKKMPHCGSVKGTIR